ncbi:LysR family transcriptional regulator, partial [Pseudomonas syringae pv. actinidiae]|nr:LysR family transcriptional regulator [Pseudomonas syringae pv. actinidiae]
HRPPPLALKALYPPHRQLSRRVRVFVDWLVELCDHPDIRDRLVS